VLCTGEIEPIGQLLHVSGPDTALNFPATHSEHVPPSDPVEPALHVQAVETELPNTEFEFVGHVEQYVAPAAAEYVPIPQSMHVSDPVSALYFPATHSEHVPPSGPDEPALHVHAVETELPNRELEFVGHVEQLRASVAPTTAEYVPVSQSIHVVESVSVLYFPATHSEQVSVDIVCPAPQTH